MKAITKTVLLAAAGSSLLLGGCMGDGGGRPGYAGSAYDWNRPDPAYGGYQADRYYRDAPTYRERRLARNDRVYRGQDNRYYCRRNDGTTGLIVGALAGGLLGNAIAPGGSETLGTLLGAGGGALAGKAIDQSQARCK